MYPKKPVNTAIIRTYADQIKIDASWCSGSTSDFDSDRASSNLVEVVTICLEFLFIHVGLFTHVGLLSLVTIKAHQEYIL